MEFRASQSSVDGVDSTDTARPESSSRRQSTRPNRGREPLEPLIVAALRSAPDNRLLLTDIYRYIEANSADYGEDTVTQTLPSSTSTGAEQGRRTRTKEPAWKIHVRHILSVKRDVFPLTSEKDGKRRGRYHALDELQYARKLAAKAQRGAVVNVGGLTTSSVSTSSEPANHRQKQRNRGSFDQSPYNQQSHGDLTSAFLSADRLWCSTSVTAAVARPDSWQSALSTGGSVQFNTVVLPSQPADVLHDMDAEYLMPDGGNSRDSWSSTTSNTAAVSEHPQCSVYGLPPRQPSHYRHSMDQQHQQQQLHMYDWTQQHHTWANVETNQSGNRHQMYAHQQQLVQGINMPASHSDQRQYLRPTSSRHAHPYQSTCHSATCLYPAVSTRLRPVITTVTPAQHPATQRGWISEGNQCIRASYGQPHPLSTYNQRTTSSQTAAPCWYRLDNNPACTQMPAAAATCQSTGAQHFQ